jgi:flavin reductase (DIM6/NTAB) family NADH-FMN oxidoreductase RutF
VVERGIKNMKIKLGSIPYVYPIPIVLAGANIRGRPNYATLGDCGVMGIKPPLVYVSLHKEHYTTRGVLENGTFSVNFPSTELLSITDYCGLVSGKEVDKSELFVTFYGELRTAPMIDECPVNLECSVVHDFSIEHRHIFVGEVVQAYVGQEYLAESGEHRSVADLTRLDPIIYALDNRYYRIGDPIGVGYREGKAFQQRKRDSAD